VVAGEKQGGNVASYFCTPGGEILDAIAGPVDADTLLREARWVVETRKMALLKANGDAGQIKQAFRQANADRLPSGTVPLDWKNMPFYQPSEEALATVLDTNPAVQQLDQQGRVHLLLALYPLVKLDQAYKVVYEKILNETVSTQPVEVTN
jgi:hypothetical protein